ncbi:hypothetical protein NLD30_06795 [SCandidatus Aminicenantes bacterium Aminicenantia_JdfR_composite]|jgi:hypothetical protein|nr:hypothetical protein [SCandidatus Aminicenantes bacterium Aminicenantia_JdfR_composite]MCP2596986.1 hypothetical protein [Candidatus Aminicenantes bacterium AC-335-G13]MCP2598690.1 hypothetical protein [Candidatus Aminicenantes bacterium AC-335-L06]MCP2620622.1 hypothetical protein [Candidatus Aminicenantes bacterium AC-334-E05]
MGVFHLSGLGLNPGAVTVPLTYIYYILKQCEVGDTNSRNFFIHSGEEDEILKGKPEALIIFTSEEVILGKKQRDIKDNIFKTKKQKSAPFTIMKFLANLIKELKFSECLYGEYGIKYLYFIKVDINRFEDCYKKIFLTMKALQNKEVECNLIGGTNQINLSLMLAGAITGVVSRLYYVFETDIQLMHPSFVNQKDLKVPVPPLNWFEIPPFFISIGDLIKKLESVGILYNPVNIAQIKDILDDLNLTKQFLAKLRGRWILIDNDKVEAGPLLKNTIKIHRMLEAESKNVQNFTEFKNYFSKKGYLYKFIEDGKECQIL